MSYRSTVSLLPFIGEESRKAVSEMETILRLLIVRRETAAWSVDDALALVKNGDPGSMIRFWNANTRPDHEIKRVIEESPKVEWFNAPGFQPFIIDVVDQLKKHETLKYSLRTTEEIKTLTIHHSVSWYNYQTNLENVENFARYHVNSKQWPGIGYHYVIAPDGQIFRTNELNTVSYHAGSYSAPGDENVSSVGICLGGDFRNSIPSQPQIWAARSLCDSLKLGLSSSIAVIPHKRMPGAATMCPGEFNLEKWLRVIGGQDDVF